MPEVLEVNADEMFEILCADCLRDEPFPREIQVIGKALGWARIIQTKATERKVKLTITVEDI